MTTVRRFNIAYEVDVNHPEAPKFAILQELLKMPYIRELTVHVTEEITK